MITGRHRRSLLDTRAMREEDANSGNHLVLARVRLKLCRTTKERKRGRKLYDTTKLRDHQVKEQSRIEIRDRFEALTKDEDDSIEQSWLQLKKAYNKSTEAVFGERRRIKSDWISVKTYRSMAEMADQRATRAGQTCATESAEERRVQKKGHGGASEYMSGQEENGGQQAENAGSNISGLY